MGVTPPVREDTGVTPTLGSAVLFSMADYIRKQRTGFTQVTNEVLNDRRLSWKAKGLYAYIYSKPDGWNFAYRRMAADSRDGDRATLAAIQELEDLGYVKRHRQGDGRIEYHILIKPESGFAAQDTPSAKTAQSGFRTEPKPLRAETALVSNKEGRAIKSSNNKEGDIHEKLKKVRVSLTSRGIIRAAARRKDV